ncbi:MAG: MerR family transcriptional regulator [Clostridiales bacterium]|nr:MerR family transcriptional regulator [Clostridiales bacterium]
MKDQWIKDDLTIGEISRIHNIPAKMLRYWDKIGLFKPYKIDPVTGYRYYSSAQFYILNFIKYFRTLGIPYEEIKNRLNNTDMISLIQLLKEQTELTDRKINELKTIKNIFNSHILEMEEALQVKDLEEITVKYYPERKIVYLENSITSRLEFEKAIRRLEKIIDGSPTLLLPKVGLVMDKRDFEEKNYDEFKAVFVFNSEGYNSEGKYYKIIPSGDYARICFWGSIKNSKKYYEMVYNYIKEKGYVICGDVIRRCVCAGIIGNNHEHLAEIWIQVQKK